MTSDDRLNRKDHTMHIGPYQISLRRTRPSKARRAGAVAACATAAMSLLALVAVAAPAGAGSGATGTVAVSQTAVTSISVSPITFDYSSCFAHGGGGSPSDTVQFPNGDCLSPDGAVTITNGSSPGSVYIVASDFQPSDGTGNPWTLCAGSAAAPSLGVAVCTNAGLEGVDQVGIWNQTGPLGSGGLGPFSLGKTAACDKAFDGSGCSATAGQSASEMLGMEAPSSSTDLSPSFSNTVTWIAVSS
ncbi:MAG TPA: hypothetical protein VMT43_08805 [Acidimicrobiales bacterium]|nr:hypothetical protein [Acidimicrobiales bacterium]